MFSKTLIFLYLQEYKVEKYQVFVWNFFEFAEKVLNIDNT